MTLSLTGSDDANGASLITLERYRQRDSEGWTAEHDDGHTLGEMAAAGACYALLSTRWRDSAILGSSLIRSVLWPWDAEWFKPSDYPDPPYTPNVHDERRIRDLTKAGALIAAEIDRLQRRRRV
ncbi:MAG TPA: hypothetical protein VIO80_00895 [Candidatus Dormibacteraeota bacterium]